MADKDDQISRIEDKVDVIIYRISNIDITAAKQQVSLDEHIRRTAILESELEPIKNHVAMVHGVLKFIGLVSVVVGVIESITRFFHA
jgi:hypothetical protein